MKNPFKGIKLSNFKKNWELARSDPYIAAKTNYNMTRWLVYGLMGILAFTFFKLIISVRGSSSAFTLGYQAIMLIIGVIILSKIYFSVLEPLRRTLNHYEADKRTITSHFVDTNAEIDEIFSHFEKKKKQGVTK